MKSTLIVVSVTTSCTVYSVPVTVEGLVKSTVAVTSRDPSLLSLCIGVVKVNVPEPEKGSRY